MVCCQHHCLIKAEQVLPRCTVCCMCRAALLNPNIAAKQPQTKSMRQKLTRKERFAHKFSDIQFCIGDICVVNEYGLCLIVIERRVSFLWIRTLYQCTMRLSPCKGVNQRFEPDFHRSPHFLVVYLFQTKFRGKCHFHFLFILVLPQISLNSSTDKNIVFWLFLGEGFTYR